MDGRMDGGVGGWEGGGMGGLHVFTEVTSQRGKGKGLGFGFGRRKAATKTTGPRSKQEPLRTGRTGSSHVPPANRCKRLPPVLSRCPGRSSHSCKRKHGFTPIVGGSPRPAQPLSARSLRGRLAS